MPAQLASKNNSMYQQQPEPFLCHGHLLDKLIQKLEQFITNTILIFSQSDIIVLTTFSFSSKFQLFTIKALWQRLTSHSISIVNLKSAQHWLAQYFKTLLSNGYNTYWGHNFIFLQIIIQRVSPLSTLGNRWKELCMLVNVNGFRLLLYLCFSRSVSLLKNN